MPIESKLENYIQLENSLFNLKRPLIQVENSPNDLKSPNQLENRQSKRPRNREHVDSRSSPAPSGSRGFGGMTEKLASLANSAAWT
jgi:hypothetical protein